MAIKYIFLLCIKMCYITMEFISLFVCSIKKTILLSVRNNIIYASNNSLKQFSQTRSKFVRYFFISICCRVHLLQKHFVQFLQ